MAKNTYALPIGELVGKTFSLYLRNLLPFALLCALVLLPWIALRLSLRESMTPALAGALSMLQTLLGFVLTGAVTYSVVQQMGSKSVGLGELISVGMQSIFRVLLTSIVTGLLIGFGFLLLFVPGIIATVILFVAVPAAVIERVGVGDAMRRSADLTKGSRWRVFGAALLIGVILAGVGLLGAFVLAPTPEEGPPFWFEVVIGVVLTPLSATMYAVCYVLLRQGKENVDVAQIAAVFD